MPSPNLRRIWSAPIVLEGDLDFEPPTRCDVLTDDTFGWGNVTDSRDSYIRGRDNYYEDSWNGSSMRGSFGNRGKAGLRLGDNNHWFEPPDEEVGSTTWTDPTPGWHSEFINDVFSKDGKTVHYYYIPYPPPPITQAVYNGNGNFPINQNAPPSVAVSRTGGCGS